MLDCLTVPMCVIELHKSLSVLEGHVSDLCIYMLIERIKRCSQPV